ncbi:hypothetical protein P4679_23815 [Priestia megaterium]|uniref:hypothetical protein n=1 Tax=Priestia megaterium TaxID=1404 RepID=UPI002E24B1FC|nr:hypothetical protein [Priestia megaterium]
MGKDKVLQLRITDSSDPRIIEWANAQTLSSSEIIKFFIEFDIALNGGVRDIAEVITSKRTEGFMQSYINALIHRSNNEQVEVIYDRQAGTIARRIPVQTTQGPVSPSNNYNSVEEKATSSTETIQLNKEAVDNPPPSNESLAQNQGPSMEEMQKQIAILQEQLYNNQQQQQQQQQQEPVKEQVTDSITRPPEPKISEVEQEHNNKVNTTKNDTTDSVETLIEEVEESGGDDLDKLKNSFSVDDW